MARVFLHERAKSDLTGAIRAVESRSAAEVVIAVRAASGSYLHADLLAGILAAYAVLGFMLFSPWPFHLEWIFVDPAVFGVIAAFAAARTPAVRRALTSVAARERAVNSAARSAYHERGVGLTRDRTGVLVYVSLLERRAVVLADRGVVDRVEAAVWAERVAAIDAAVARGEDGVAVARLVAGLSDVLAAALPRATGDVNELADEVGG